MPPSIMPGFDGILSEDNRWDLINFLRTLSSGYEARILSDKIVYKKPWLPAVDFDFVTLKGKTGRLSQYRGKKTIILIIFLYQILRIHLILILVIKYQSHLKKMM